ncbi:MAG TPA: phosphate signaling complex protein PhoU [Parvularculaceae bacterium]|nr:phosphate signaling complex protein PhoU [Parvularculaceae bacterium]
MSSAGQARPIDDLRGLSVDIARMASLVESQLNDAIGAFERRDVLLAERLIKDDEKVDEMHVAVESKVMALLSEGRHEQAALREIIAYLKVAGDLERVGDLAKNVAKRTLVISRERPPKPYAAVARLGRASLRQISDILNALAARNLTGAHAVWGSDEELDELHNSLFREIADATREERNDVQACIQLAFIAKNFERVGDHATNIAEAIQFLLTGATLRR